MTIMEKNRQDRCRERRERSGFTLLEVMIVLFILMTLAALAIVAVRGQQQEAQRRAAFTFVKMLESAVERYTGDMGFPPESLDALVTPPDPKGSWAGPYIRDNTTSRDPWGSDYMYTTPGSRSGREYDIWSFGPDRIDGTDDDIGSWMSQLN